MLYEELKSRTNGKCTYEEYEAVNAVYMSLDDMTKEQAAKLWRQLYAKRYAAAKKEAETKSHSKRFIYEFMKDAYDGEERLLPNGDHIMAKYNVTAPNGVKYASFYHVKYSIQSGRTVTYIGRDNFAENIVSADGNPYKLTA